MVILNHTTKIIHDSTPKRQCNPRYFANTEDITEEDAFGLADIGFARYCKYCFPHKINKLVVKPKKKRLPSVGMFDDD